MSVFHENALDMTLLLVRLGSNKTNHSYVKQKFKNSEFCAAAMLMLLIKVKLRLQSGVGCNYVAFKAA